MTGEKVEKTLHCTEFLITCEFSASTEVNDSRKHVRVGGQVSVSLHSAANADRAENSLYHHQYALHAGSRTVHK